MDGSVCGLEDECIVADEVLCCNTKRAARTQRGRCIGFEARNSTIRPTSRPLVVVKSAAEISCFPQSRGGHVEGFLALRDLGAGSRAACRVGRRDSRRGAGRSGRLGDLVCRRGRWFHEGLVERGGADGFGARPGGRLHGSSARCQHQSRVTGSPARRVWPSIRSRTRSTLPSTMGRARCGRSRRSPRRSDALEGHEIVDGGGGSPKRARLPAQW